MPVEVELLEEMVEEIINNAHGWDSNGPPEFCQYCKARFNHKTSSVYDLEHDDDCLFLKALRLQSAIIKHQDEKESDS